MKVFLTQRERLGLFRNPPPTCWDFTFDPMPALKEKSILEFVEPGWNRICARGLCSAVGKSPNQDRPYRATIVQFIDMREKRAAVVEDGRMRLMGIAARLKGINEIYAERRDHIEFMLQLALRATGDRAEIQAFLRTNPVPDGLRKLGYRTLIDNLWAAMELPS